MIIGSGFSRDVGGVQGLGYRGLAFDAKYGLSASDWYDLNLREQELFIQDFNRSDKQETYFDDSPQAYAFDYVNFIDDTKESGQEFVQDIKQPATDIALGIGLLGLALLFRS
jgi:hypothetical protein